jgi:HK97 family phage major capsid protein
VPCSIEVGQDAAALAQEMQRLIGEAFDEAEGAAFWTGSGTGEPFGLITPLDANTKVEVATTTNDTYGLADVYKLQKALPARFRRNASWAASIDVLDRTRRFGEGTTGIQSAYWADLGAAVPPTLLGHPVYEASGMETFDATGAEKVRVIGDFAAGYRIVDRVGTTIELVPHLFGATNGRPTGQRGWLAYKRVGGDSVNDNAFRVLQS